MKDISSFSTDEIQAMVIAAHSDLARVQAMLAEEPALLNVMFKPWQETPLGAASHVGNRSITEFLLAEGAPLTVCTAAMLGQLEDVKAFIAEDPAAASALGAHKIPVLAHAGYGGSRELVQLLLDQGDGAGKNGAIFAAIARDDLSIVDLLLSDEVDLSATNFKGQTPVELADDLGHESIAQRLRAASG